MLQLSPSLFPFAASWAGSIRLGLLDQLMNGHSACLLPFWQDPCSMPQSKCTSLVLEPCILNKVSPILFRTVFACSVIRGIKRSQGTPSSSCLPITEVLGCPSFWTLRSPSPERLGGSCLPGGHGCLPVVLLFLRPPFPLTFKAPVPNLINLCQV